MASILLRAERYREENAMGKYKNTKGEDSM